MRLLISSGRIYISRDVVFDETVFPFYELHANAGARLRSEILLFPSLFISGGDNVLNHLTNPVNPAANESFDASIEADTADPAATEDPAGSVFDADAMDQPPVQSPVASSDGQAAGGVADGISSAPLSYRHAALQTSSRRPCGASRDNSSGGTEGAASVTRLQAFERKRYILMVKLSILILAVLENLAMI